MTKETVSHIPSELVYRTPVYVTCVRSRIVAIIAPKVSLLPGNLFTSLNQFVDLSGNLIAII